MKRSSVRAFGIALFLAGGSYASIQQFNIDVGIFTTENNSEIKLEKDLKLANEKIAELETQLKSSELKQKSSTTKNVNDDQENPKTSSTNEGRKTTTIQLYKNITPYIISEKLEDAGIIQNALELELFLAKDEYARSLQIGEYKLHSDMTLKEIADTITKSN